MKLIVEIPDSNLFGGVTEEAVRSDVQTILGKSYNWSGIGKVQVMIDDRPEPMDFVKEIIVVNGVTRVHFTNGHYAWSNWDNVRSRRDAPNLREGR